MISVVLYVLVCARQFVAEVPQHDERVSPNTDPPLSPSQSSSVRDVSSAFDPYADV